MLNERSSEDRAGSPAPPKPGQVSCLKRGKAQRKDRGIVEVRRTDRFGVYELSIVKWADWQDNALAVAWGSLGMALDIWSNGWLGWGPDLTQSRWLVRVRDQRTTDDVRTVGTAFTQFGARRRARRVRKTLWSGDEEAIRALPDLVF